MLFDINITLTNRRPFRSNAERFIVSMPKEWKNVSTIDAYEKQRLWPLTRRTTGQGIERTPFNLSAVQIRNGTS